MVAERLVRLGFFLGKSLQPKTNTSFGKRSLFSYSNVPILGAHQRLNLNLNREIQNQQLLQIRYFSDKRKNRTSKTENEPIDDIPTDAEGNVLIEEPPVDIAAEIPIPRPRKAGQYKVEGDEYGGDAQYSSFATSYGQLHAARRLGKLNTRPTPVHKAQAVVNAVCTKNNCHLTCTDFKGNAIVNISGGVIELGGMKKGSPFGGLRAGEEAGLKLLGKGIQFVDLRLKGFGKGRNSVHRGLKASGIKIVSITQSGSVPHNGCRPKKARRL
mmetsp:Transcript_2416/g.3086  ORF Transcript_2416/g.3086 Transcript_2416/m.3086 type:complete len:270 (-) Transcript_2416:1221-2030(-)|eukprot:CAMPEP_0204832196 /NCGR_PEP_ID=MMETSP1346-20131115/12869_1 /ASSEMBLY_ACC=CAM_ASM_000771 /TAXON_ID=215587 /ORGANISM="Aplanochytrium stocchinoi, Strain GSBS06" /LENGTH=269 /DNA_ID=CAMNT_0051963841 /DNA_START=134 /DNA_END=943 /DNA_ORIENTATION=-